MMYIFHILNFQIDIWIIIALSFSTFVSNDMAGAEIEGGDVFDVIVIGAGVAGATAAHSIASVSPSTQVLVLERGVSGRGDEDSTLGSRTDCDGRDVRPFISGSAVFDESEGPTAVKMMISLYAATTEEFLREHSMDDAKTWFRMTALGLQLQKEKAIKILPSPSNQIRQLGSIMVATPEKAEELAKEFQLLVQAGCNVRKLSFNEVVAATGTSSGFTEGIEFPDDAIIDSSAYAQALLRDSKSRGTVAVREHCSSVVDIVEKKESNIVTVQMSDGKIVQGRHVVVATGAFYLKGPLSGLINPCYSYLVGMPACAGSESQGGMSYPHSPNLFTYGFSHDWSLAEGVCRMSGEDHFSAMKLPRAEQRCQSLAEWTYNRFPQLDRSQPFSGRYGVYSETPDLLPIFGTTSSESRVCYIVGCNAWGQSVMSSLGHVVPAVLGLRPFDPTEESILKLCSIRRFVAACQR